MIARSDRSAPLRPRGLSLSAHTSATGLPTRKIASNPGHRCFSISSPLQSAGVVRGAAGSFRASIVDVDWDRQANCIEGTGAMPPAPRHGVGIVGLESRPSTGGRRAANDRIVLRPLQTQVRACFPAPTQGRAKRRRSPAPAGHRVGPAKAMRRQRAHQSSERNGAAGRPAPL